MDFFSLINFQLSSLGFTIFNNTSIITNNQLKTWTTPPPLLQHALPVSFFSKGGIFLKKRPFLTCISGMFHLYNLICDRRKFKITSPRGRNNTPTPTRLYRGRDGQITPTRLYRGRDGQTTPTRQCRGRGGISIKPCSSGNEGKINTRRIWTKSGRRWNLWIKEYLEYNPGRHKRI